MQYYLALDYPNVVLPRTESPTLDSQD